MGNFVMEIKDLVGFEGLYKVGSDGVLYSVRNGRLTRLVGGTDGNYRHHSLRKDGKQYQRTLHSLVAKTFIPNPEGKAEVNHIDGDKMNNRVDNLEWVTRSENAKHAYDNGLIKISDEHLHTMRKNFAENNARFTETDAHNIRAIYKYMDKPNMRRIAEAYGTTKTCIQRIVRGKQKYFRRAA